jgi:4-amino-4-deoxy-L-arabinose transferase-like glycosyltransferase
LRSRLSSDRNLNFDGNSTPVKTALFLLVCLAWLLPGLTGHSPWKYDEGVSQGIVHGLVHGGSHWLSPDLAGEPYLAHPPFYFWVAALLVKALGGLIPDHDAARLSSGLFMALTMTGVAIAANALYGQRAMRASVILFIGSVGLIIRAHEMSAELSWLTGVTYALAAVPLSRTRPALAGFAGGLGFGMAFLSHGLLALGLLLPIVLLTPLLVRDYRPAKPVRHVAFWLLSVAPFLVLWPWALHHNSPESFVQWWQVLAVTTERPNLWPAVDAIPLYYFGAVAWFAWPATPLAIWALWEGRLRGLAKPQTRFLLLTLAIMLGVLGFCTTPRETNALPLLIPLALLGGGSIDTLRRGATSAFDWFGMLTFGIITLILWLGWFAQMTGHPESVVRYLDAQLPGYQATFQPVAFAASLLLTLLWVLTIAHSRQSPRRALLNWTVGMTVSWLLLMTLWLPYVEASRSYQGMMHSLAKALPAQAGCIASTGLGEPQRGLLYYYLNIRTQRLELGKGSHCHLWLVQSHPQDAIPVPSGWRLLWAGARPGDRTERFQLFGD